MTEEELKAEEAKKKADEEARQKADEEAKKKADEEAKKKADEEKKRGAGERDPAFDTAVKDIARLKKHTGLDEKKGEETRDSKIAVFNLFD